MTDPMAGSAVKPAGTTARATTKGYILGLGRIENVKWNPDTGNCMTINQTTFVSQIFDVVVIG